MADATGQPSQLHSDLLQLIDSSKRIEEILMKAGGGGKGGGGGLATAAMAASMLGGHTVSGQTPQTVQIGAMADMAHSAFMMGSAQILEQRRQTMQAGIIANNNLSLLTQYHDLANFGQHTPAGDAVRQAIAQQTATYQQASSSYKTKLDTALTNAQEASERLSDKHAITHRYGQSAMQDVQDAQGGQGGSKGGGNSGLWKTAGIAAAVKFMLAGGTGASYGNYAANQQMIQSANQTNAAMFTALVTAIFSPSKVLSAVRAGARFVGSGWGG